MIVVGGGPVGMSAALLLARWGVPVVVLERRTSRRVAGSRSICQHRDVLDIWASVGAGRPIASEGVTWQTARTYWREHELFTLTLRDPGQSPFPPFVNISQSRTEQILAEQVSAAALIQTKWGHEVTSVDQDGEGVTVLCSTNNGEVTRGAYALVCAGGRADALRRALGVSFDGSAFDDHFLICDIRCSLPGWEAERRFYFDPDWNPGRQVLIHPCPDSTYRIDWQVPPDFDLDAEDRSGGLDRRIRQIVGEAPYELLWRSVYRFDSRCVDRMRVGRVLLAGDSAHLMAPFGARGLNSGIQDAENAAWKLAFVLHGWASEGLLESYHSERHAAALENLDVTNATMQFLVPHDRAERAAREAALRAALGDPEARSRVNSGRLAEPFWYADSPLTTPDRSRPKPTRPPGGAASPAAPGVLVPDVPIAVAERPEASRLREIARDGLLALTTAGPLEVDRALKQVTDAPARSYSIGAIDATGALRTALRFRDGETWLIRPDAHVAAILPPSAPDHALREAARRALGHGIGKSGEIDDHLSSYGR